jgi:hypothetical protein
MAIVRIANQFIVSLMASESLMDTLAFGVS